VGTGTLVHYEQTVREEDCGEWVRVHRYTMRKQSGRRLRRVGTGTRVYYESTLMEAGTAPPPWCAWVWAWVCAWVWAPC
jgi:hypothetical protein